MPHKDLLLLKGLRRGDLKSFSPHPTPHFSAWFFQQKNRRWCPNKGLTEEDSSGPLLWRELHFRPGKIGVDDPIESKYTLANWKKSNEIIDGMKNIARWHHFVIYGCQRFSETEFIEEINRQSHRWLCLFFIILICLISFWLVFHRP